MKKVICNKCDKEFDNLLKQETKEVEGVEITHTYLQCPNCGEVYTVCYDSIATIVLKKQIRKCVVALQTIKDNRRYEQKLKEIKKKQNRLERETNILQSKYCKYFVEKEKKERK